MIKQCYYHSVGVAQWTHIPDAQRQSTQGRPCVRGRIHLSPSVHDPSTRRTTFLCTDSTTTTTHSFRQHLSGINNKLIIQMITRICTDTVLNRAHCKHLLAARMSQKNPPPPRGRDIFSFFYKRLRICNRFFTHLLNVPIFGRLQIFIQLSQILAKLCHFRRDYPVHIICAKCPKRTKTRAFRRLRKSLNDSFVDRCLWQVTIK